MQVDHALRSASVLCVGPVFNLHNSCKEKHASLPELIKMTVEGSLNAPGAIFKLYFLLHRKYEHSTARIDSSNQLIQFLSHPGGHRKLFLLSDF